MTFHNFKNKGMVVMDNRRVVANARKIRSGGWLLKIHAGSWTDPAAHRPAFDRPGMPIYTHLMHVKTQAQARKLLRTLADA